METITHDPQWEALVARAAERERRTRRRASYLALVPVALALGLLAFTGWQVAQNVAALQQTRGELKAAQTELDQSSAQVDAVNQELVTLRRDAESARQELDTARQKLDTTRQELDATYRALDDMKMQLDEQSRAALAAETRAKELQAEVDRLNAQIEELRGQLQVAQEFGNFPFRGSMAVTMKAEAQINPALFERLQRLSALEKTPWALTGVTPEQGFNSPTFAAYVLAEEQRLPQPEASITSNVLQAQLGMQPMPPRWESAAAWPVGAVIFYPQGYALFAFLDEANRPFVMGMTPLGVLALQPDFAQPIGYAETLR